MKLAWHVTGTRVFETGVDRGVLYLSGKPGVPWNGLTSVSESKAGGDPQPYYVDGVKYLNLATSEEFAATITAYSAPDEFLVCSGMAGIQNGLFADQQRRQQFDFSYRSKMGNDSFGIDYGYKIHIVYNALAGPSTRNYKTTNNSPEAMELSWDITTIPEYLSTFRPTSHFVVDSTKADPIALGYLESILYGTMQLDPRLPTPTELKNLFGFIPTRPIPGPVNILGEITTPSQKITNLLTNPDFETAGATTVVWQNLLTNPDFETAGSAVVVRTNWIKNSNFETDASFWTATGSTFSRSTAQSHQGTASLQVVTPGTTAGEGVYSTPYSIPGVVQGTPYAASIWVLAPAGATMQALTNTVGTGGSVPAVSFTGTGTWQFVSMPNNLSNSGLAPYIVVRTASTAQAITFYVDEAILETNVSTIGTYFDGGSRPVLRTNLATIPRSDGNWSWGFGTTGAGTMSVIADTDFPGGMSRQLTWTTAPTATSALFLGQSGQIPGIVPGVTYTISYYAKYWPGANPDIYAPNGTRGSVTVDKSRAAWRVWCTWTPNAGVTAFGGSLSAATAGGGTLPSPGQTFRAGAFQIEIGSTPSTYFDGSTVVPGFSYAFAGAANNSLSTEIDADLSVRWQGTANASASELYGTAPAGWTGSAPNRIAIIQSVRYMKFGTKSARCIPLPGATGDEYINFDIPAAGRTIGGTVMASRYQEVVVPNAPAYADRALRPVVFTPSTIAPGLVNGPGWQDMRVSYPTLTSVYQLRLYHGGLYGSGDVWWDMAALVPGVYNGPYFDGSTQPVLATNLSVNPNAVSLSYGFGNNNAATWTVARNVVAPAGNPQGITTAASSILNGAQSTVTLMSIYNPDSLANTGPTRRIGAWFYVNNSGYQAKINSSDTPTPLTANNWTWVIGGTTPSNSYAGAFVEKASGQGNAGTSDIAYVTGVTAYSDGTVPTRTVSGEVTYLPGFATSFTGGANVSPSVLWDADLNVRWQSTVNASISEVIGIGINNWIVANSVVIQSTRWAKQGLYSARVIANHPTNRSYIEWTGGVIAPVGLDTGIATVYSEATIPAGGPRPQSLGLGYNAGNLSNVTPPRTAIGEAELRLAATMAVPGRFILFADTKMGDPDVWFDLATLVSGSYSGPAFTGDTPGFIYNNTEMKPLWGGAANASTSSIEYWTEFLTPASQGDAYIIAGNLWVYNSGAWGNYGPVPTT